MLYAKAQNLLMLLRLLESEKICNSLLYLRKLLIIIYLLLLIVLLLYFVFGQLKSNEVEDEPVLSFKNVVDYKKING